MRPMIVGHRGAPNLSPENTIPSFLKAIEVGVDIIELDTRMTKDGAIVVIHDETVDRTTNGSGLVRDLTLDQIKRLDAGSVFGSSSKGVTVPTLEEALVAIDGRTMTRIELKDDGMEQKVSNLVKQLGVTNKVQVASFEFGRVKKLRKLCPRVTAVTISAKFTKDVLLSSIESYANVLAILVGRFQEADIFETHVHGLTFDAWPVDEGVHARRLVDAGVDGITSNRASEIFEFLRK